MAVLRGMPTIQYSVHKLFTSCIRRGLVSCDSILDGDCLPATKWCQRYQPYRQPASGLSEKFGNTFHVRTVLAREMTLNWFQR